MNSQPDERKNPGKPLRLDFSKIETYSTCPMMYKFRYVFKIRAPKEAKPVFGQVMHETLQQFYTGLIDGKSPDKTELLRLYTGNWGSEGYRDELEEQKFRERGRKQLEEFFENNRGDFHVPLLVEKRFSFMVGDITLTGKIDRIDDLGSGGIEIIDYKTGKSKKQKEVDDDRQLSIYAAAVPHILPHKKPERLTFLYLDSNETLSTARSPEQIEETLEQIRETAAKIRENRFEPVENHHCTMCPYTWICPAKQPLRDAVSDTS